jgi:hypothetical protein
MRMAGADLVRKIVGLGMKRKVLTVKVKIVKVKLVESKLMKC